MEFPENIDDYILQNASKFEDRGGWLPPEKYQDENIELNFQVLEDPLERKLLQEYYFSAGSLVHTTASPTYIRLFDPDKLSMDIGIVIKFDEKYHKSYVYLKDGRVIATFLGNEIFRYIRNTSKWKNLVEDTSKYFEIVAQKYSQFTISELYNIRDKLIENGSNKYIKPNSTSYLTINGMKIRKEVVELKIVKYVIYLRQIDLNFLDRINEELTQTSKRRKTVNSSLHRKMLERVDEEVKEMINDVRNSGYKRKIRNVKFTDIISLEDDNEVVKAPIEKPEEWYKLTKYDSSWYISFFHDEIVEINDYMIEVIKENKINNFTESYSEDIAKGLEHYITWEGSKIDTEAPYTEDSSSDFDGSSPGQVSFKSANSSACSTCS